MIGQIIHIDAKNDRRSFTVGDRANDIHQFGLAVIAAINIVRSVRSPFHFGSAHRSPTQIPFLRELSTIRLFIASETGRYSRDRVGTFCTKNFVSNRCNKSRVSTSTKSSDNRTKIVDDRHKFGQLDLHFDRKAQGFKDCHPPIVPRQGAQLLSLRSLIYG
jgi:hypothetical protein